MSGPEIFSVELSSSFERDLISLLKKHYKRLTKPRQEFEKLLGDTYDHLTSDPDLGNLEPWPRGAYQEGLELRKYRFSMPGLRGQSSHGRLIYLVNLSHHTVTLLRLYTHAEYSGRPPDKDLKRVIGDHM